MRCLACDHALSDAESTAKYESTGEFIDLCLKCSEAAGLKVVVNPTAKDYQEEELELPDNYDEALGG
jgi:hypothetical protein